MKSTIPSRERSKLVAQFLEKEITVREQSLYLRAKELEENNALNKETIEWDKEFGNDGLENV